MATVGAKVSLLPTRKWWAATIIAAGTVIGMVLTGDGINNDTEVTAVIGLGVQRLIAWLVPNGETT